MSPADCSRIRASSFEFRTSSHATRPSARRPYLRRAWNPNLSVGRRVSVCLSGWLESGPICVRKRNHFVRALLGPAAGTRRKVGAGAAPLRRSAAGRGQRATTSRPVQPMGSAGRCGRAREQVRRRNGFGSTALRADGRTGVRSRTNTARLGAARLRCARPLGRLVVIFVADRSD